MTVPVPVQVAQGLPVGEAFLLGVVRGLPHKFKHGLPHVCKKNEGLWVWNIAGLSPSPFSLGSDYSGWDYPDNPPKERPTLRGQGELPVRSGGL